MSGPAKLFRKAWRRTGAIRFKTLGFANKGTTWARLERGWVQAIHLQQSHYNSSLSAGLFVNLMRRRALVNGGKRLSEALDWRGWTVDDVALQPWQSWRGHYHVRLGDLLPPDQPAIPEYGYDPEDPMSIDAAAATILAHLDSYGLPWLGDPIAHSPIEGGTRARLLLRYFGTRPVPVRRPIAPSPASAARIARLEAIGVPQEGALSPNGEERA